MRWVPRCEQGVRLTYTAVLHLADRDILKMCFRTKDKSIPSALHQLRSSALLTARAAWSSTMLEFALEHGFDGLHHGPHGTRQKVGTKLAQSYFEKYQDTYGSSVSRAKHLSLTSEASLPAKVLFHCFNFGMRVFLSSSSTSVMPCRSKRVARNWPISPT